MKLMVKRTIGHFRVLIDHCRRRREPSPEHVLERMVITHSVGIFLTFF